MLGILGLSHLAGYQTIRRLRRMRQRGLGTQRIDVSAWSEAEGNLHAWVLRDKSLTLC